MAEQRYLLTERKGLPSYQWHYSYKTSSTLIDGRPVNILHDFYIPALRHSVKYDRVAGYFRSSSLAVASQGFSTFVGRQGRMRLIVGAELEPHDVRAILAGDEQRLAARLENELEDWASWPENVKNGVSLLAWMVAKGHLEVRVALRLHRETGEPLSIDAVDDGYVHEKWFIFYDEAGNRLYGNGSLNESKTALVLNAENIDVHCDWWGERERQRIDEAASAFENLWQGRVQHMPVMTLPEAVRRRFIRIARGVIRPVEIDGTSEAPPSDPAPSALERLQFALLRDGPKMPGGRFVGMETAPVEPWPHQKVVVQRLVETWPYSYLLCDEVGLGKTIEAGLAFRSLYLSGLVKRILIAAPASLTHQWQRQMASKMLLSFGRVITTPQLRHEYIFPKKEEIQANTIFDPDRVIVSTGLIARPERVASLRETESFDIVLVDEAHAARRKNSTKGAVSYPEYGRLYTSIRKYLRKGTRSLWLATATPMQIDPVEVSDLLALTNRVGAFQFDPTLTLQFYELLSKIMHDEALSKAEWEFLRQTVKTVEIQDSQLWRFLHECVIDGRIRSTLRRWLEHGRIPRSRDQKRMLRVLFSTSPLSRVMLRHTRQLLEVYRKHGQLKQNLARRVVLPLDRIVFTSLEQRIYDQLEEYSSGLAQQIQTHGNKQSQQMISFLLTFLRLRFASSLYAFRETVRRRLYKVEITLLHQQENKSPQESSSPEDWLFEEEVEDDREAVEFLLKNRTVADLQWEQERLKKMLQDMGELQGHSSKMQVLLEKLDQRRSRQKGRIDQTVIFTRFYDTLKDIVNRLHQVDPQMLIGTYSGQEATYFDPQRNQMITVDREEVKERFLRGEIDVLVCTDAAAEGLNLQTANLLVNYDLGWNPMKVEQRIGRIDRIGQKHDKIYVLNLCYAGSVEEIVYGRLLTRLEQANLIVGTQQISLLPVDHEDFQQLAEGTLTPEELEARARERIEKHRQQTESMEMDPEILYEIYMRLARSEQKKAPVNLSAIWEILSESCYLQQMGCSVVEESGKQALKLSGIKDIPEGAMLTASRELYDQGLESGERLHFASYGDPYFDRVLKEIGKFNLPDCVRRISVTVPGMDGLEMVAFGVKCYGEGGSYVARLIRGWYDLQDLELAEGESLTDSEVASLQKKLEELAYAEFESHKLAPQLERENIRAARAHELLNFLVIRSLLEDKVITAGDQALIGSILRDISSLIEERDNLQLPLPADLLRPISEDLLFECPVPRLGDRAFMPIPQLLGRTAIDVANRQIDRMKLKKSELRIKTVMSSLQREIEDRSRRLL